MNKKKSILTITFMLLLIVSFSCNTKGEKPTGKPLKVEKGDIVNFINATGRVTSVKELVIRTDINAVIEKIFVKEGDQIKTGDLLLTFSPTSNDLELNLRAKQSAHDQALINNEKAEREAKISRELYKIEAESYMQLKAKEDNLRKAQITLHQAEKELRHAIIRHEKLRCVSPQDGAVVTLQLEEGMFVVTGEPLITIADTRNIEIIADIDEVDAWRINIGQEAIITSDAFPEKELKGSVIKTAPQATVKGQHTVVETTIMLKGPTDILRINNQVDIKMITDKKESVLLLPLSVVHWSNDGTYVWLQKDHTMKKAEVKTGLSDLYLIEIVSGLDEGAEVFVMSNEKEWVESR